MIKLVCFVALVIVTIRLLHISFSVTRKKNCTTSTYFPINSAVKFVHFVLCIMGLWNSLIHVLNLFRQYKTNRYAGKQTIAFLRTLLKPIKFGIKFFYEICNYQCALSSSCHKKLKQIKTKNYIIKKQQTKNLCNS